MDIFDISTLLRDTQAEKTDNLLPDSTQLFVANIKKAILDRTYPRALKKIKSGPDETSKYLAGAKILLKKGCPRTAELLLKGIIETDPSCEDAIQHLAELHEKEGAAIKTFAYTSHLIRNGASSQELSYQHAFSLYKLERHDEALEAILPVHILHPSPRVLRLCGLILKALGEWSDAIQILEKVVEESPRDVHSIRALSTCFSDLGFYQKSLDISKSIPDELTEDSDRLHQAVMLRIMGELDAAIQLNSEIITSKPRYADALWTQCFNYSIANANLASELVKASQEFWRLQMEAALPIPSIKLNQWTCNEEKIRVAFLSSDIGEHVVSRFLAPILRHYNKDRYHVTLLSSHRRFEEKAAEIATYVDSAISLQGLNIADAYSCIEAIKANIIIETNGFTANSGIGILARRCAPIQCHYIGYHATTGLDTIDYFFGDEVTVPGEFQHHYTEKLVQIPSPWIAYDSTINFPTAVPTAQRDSPVLGSFSQITKINRFTLDYWSAALKAVPDSILVIKDRGCYCETSCQRIEDTLQSMGVDPERVYFIGPVSTHLDHLDSYKAIDIALDTTPWSSATTAFEALGMGVPIVAIWGDTTSGRMSSSVVSAAGMGHLIAHSKEEFAQIVSELAKDYKQLRNNKAAMQKHIRSGILFNEQRICRDFYATIENLVQNHDCISASRPGSIPGSTA